MKANSSSGFKQRNPLKYQKEDERRRRIKTVVTQQLSKGENRRRPQLDPLDLKTELDIYLKFTPLNSYKLCFRKYISEGVDGGVKMLDVERDEDKNDQLCQVSVHAPGSRIQNRSNPADIETEREIGAALPF